MTSEESKQCVLNAWRTFASRDPKRVAEVFTEDAEWLAPKDNATAAWMKHTHHMIGRDVIARFLTQSFPAMFCGDLKIDFKHLFADGDTVILEERMQATLSNGRPYDNDYCLIFELRDGRIHRVREYMDTLKGQRMVFG